MLTDTSVVLKEDKGLKNGSCNRTACQVPGANHYNQYTHAYYCKSCAMKINRGAIDAGLEPFCTLDQ